MGFNLNGISKFVRIAQSIKNPKQAVNMALEALSSKNPKLAEELKTCKNNPIPVFRKYIQNGTITKDNFQAFKNVYGIARKFGLPIKVSDSDWNKLEKEFDNNIIVENTNTFRGF